MKLIYIVGKIFQTKDEAAEWLEKQAPKGSFERQNWAMMHAPVLEQSDHEAFADGADPTAPRVQVK